VSQKSAFAAAPSSERPRAHGKSLFIGDEKLYVRGVTYGTFRPNDETQDFPDRAAVAEDFAAMAENGINAVRVYTVPPRWLLDLALEHGLRVMVGLPWELNSAAGAAPKLKSKLSAFPIPGRGAGKTAPVFLGGSNLAVAAGSKQQDLAYDWLKLLAGEKYQTRLAKENGVLPNSSSLAASTLGDDPVLGAMAKGAQNGRITPNDPSWAAVEAAPNPIKDMLTKVLSGKASAADAAKEASALITQKMAGS